MELRPFRSIHIFLAIAFCIIFAATFSLHYTRVLAETPEAVKLQQEKLLKNELEKVLREIETQKQVLQVQRNQSATFERDIGILNAQIRKAKLELSANGIRIEQLSDDIKVKSSTISELEDKTIRGKESLGVLLQKVREIDDYSLVEIFLTSQSISDFLKDSDSLKTLKTTLKENLDQIAVYQKATMEQKAALEMARSQQEVVNDQIKNEKNKVEVSQNQKEVLLSASKKQEQSYEQIVAEREAKAAHIRSTLFSLRDSSNINFGQALDFARTAEKGTGVRPAFLLAIVTQESNLGQNVGRCNLPTTPGRMWSDIMKPDRDQVPYLAVVKSLGIAPEDKPLSCPIGTGWGGAMGPAQFIPSTWALYASRVTNVTGANPANPWNPRDAFAASSLFLSDLGASPQTYNAEWEAAARYYAGGGWQTRGVQYANSVLNIAAGIQQQIDALDSL